MKKPSRKYLNNKLDEEVSKLVRKKPCVKCGSFAKRANCSHYYSRSLRSVRWDLDNVKCACVGCHFWFDGHPLEHTEFVKDMIGEARFDALRLRANTPRKWEIYELQEMLQTLRGMNDES